MCHHTKQSLVRNNKMKNKTTHESWNPDAKKLLFRNSDTCEDTRQGFIRYVNVKSIIMSNNILFRDRLRTEPF